MDNELLLNRNFHFHVSKDKDGNKFIVIMQSNPKEITEEEKAQLKNSYVMPNTPENTVEDIVPNFPVIELKLIGTMTVNDCKAMLHVLSELM